MVRERGRQRQKDLIGHCGEDGVAGDALLFLAAHLQGYGPAVLHDHPLHRAARLQDATQLADSLGQDVHQEAEAPHQVAELLLLLRAALARGEAEVDLAPEPGHADVVGPLPELAPQQRPPDDVVVALAGVLDDPVLGGDRLVGAPVLLSPQPQSHQSQPHSVDQGDGREAQEVEGRDEVVDAVVVEDAHLRFAPGQAVGQAQFVDEVDDGGVDSEDVVVELLDAPAADLERAHEPAQLLPRLQ